MVDLCARPTVRGGDSLLPDHEHVTVHTAAVEGGSSRSAPSPSRRFAAGPLTIAWLTFTTLMAIAGLIMAAWAISKLPPQSPVLLVSNPQQAADMSWTTLGNVYAGTGYWSTNPMAMAHPRSDHGSAAYQGQVYVFGGVSFNVSTNQSVVLANMTRYNMYNGTYQEMDPMPEPRYRFGYAVLSDKLYIFGGFNTYEGQGTLPVGTTMVFDLVQRSWSSIQPSMSLSFARADLWGAAAGGKIYAIGGYDIEYDNSTGKYPKYDASASAEEMDPATGKWTRIPDMTTPRGDLSAQGVGSMVYVMGGYSTTAWTSSVEVYDVSKRTWSQRASMKYPRGDFSTEVLKNGNILAAGGEGNFTFGSYFRYHQAAQPWVEEYITALDIWVPKAAMFQPRFRFDMASDDGNFVYAFGGAPSCNDDEGNQADNCYMQVLSSIVGYFDNQYPNIWAAQT